MALVQMQTAASRTVVGGRYRLGERLGEGAAGVVWRAWDVRLGRSVAVKQLVIPPGLAGADARRAHADAAREGRIAARLQHPAVAGMLDMVVENGSSWLVMEHVPGRSLAEVLERSTLTPLEAARIGAVLADALAVAHAAGVVHSDVKPANVLLREDGTVKLADFGIARVVRGDDLTGPGVLSGTPLFMAPEVARGQWPDAASDVYSLAGTLYAAVEGVGPFGPMDHDEPLAMIRRVAETTPLRPRRAGPLTEVLATLLVADPTARPSAAATRDLLREIVAPVTAPVIVAPSTARPIAAPSSDPAPFSVPAAARDRAYRAPRRGRALTALSAAGVVGVGAVAGSFGGGTVMSLLTDVAPAPLDRIAVLDGGSGGQMDPSTVVTGSPGLPADGTDIVAAPAVPAVGAPIVVPDPSWSAASRADGAGEARTSAPSRRSADSGGRSGPVSRPATAVIDEPLPVEADVISDVPLDSPAVGGVVSGTTATIDDVLPIDLGASSGSGGLVEDLPVRLPVNLGSDDGLLGLPVDLPVDLPLGGGSGDSGDPDEGSSGSSLPIDLPGGLLGRSSGGSSDSNPSGSGTSDSGTSDSGRSVGVVGSLLSGDGEPLSILSFPSGRSGSDDDASGYDHTSSDGSGSSGAGRSGDGDSGDGDSGSSSAGARSSTGDAAGELSSTVGSVLGSGS